MSAPAPCASGWSHSRSKRLFDAVIATLLLFISSPLLALLALLVFASSRGPVLFRQMRAGENGRIFELLKFRTMVHNRVDPGVGLTRSGDARVTAVGRFLREWKLDELPQLLNVLRGDMSLVGPRPDLPEFFRQLTAQQQRVLQLKPGLTGWATLHFRREEDLLASVPPEQIVEYYLGSVLPQKIALDLEYAQRATFFSDIKILWQTLFALSQ